MSRFCHEVFSHQTGLFNYLQVRLHGLRRSRKFSKNNFLGSPLPRVLYRENFHNIPTFCGMVFVPIHQGLKAVCYKQGFSITNVCSFTIKMSLLLCTLYIICILNPLKENLRMFYWCIFAMFFPFSILCSFCNIGYYFSFSIHVEQTSNEMIWRNLGPTSPPHCPK